MRINNPKLEIFKLGVIYYEKLNLDKNNALVTIAKGNNKIDVVGL